MSQRWLAMVGAGGTVSLFFATALAGWRSVACPLLTPEAESRMNPLRRTAVAGIGSRRPFGGVSPNLFGAPAPPLQPDRGHPNLPQPAARNVGPPIVAPDAFEPYRVTGVVTVAGETYALVENPRAGTGEWVKAGGALAGGTVQSVNRGGIDIRTPSGNRRLALNDRFDLVPLDRDAPFLGGRETRHDLEPALESGLRTARLYTTSLALSYGLERNRDGIDFQKLADDAFEGRMGLDEYHARVNAAAPAQVLSFDSVAVVPERLTLSGAVLEVNSGLSR